MPQPTGPRIRNKSGQVLYDFLPTMRVEGLPKEREVPSLRIDGRDGEVVQMELIAEKPRAISIVGKLYGRGRNRAEQMTDLESQIDSIMRSVARREEVRISRSPTDSRYIPAYYTNMTLAYVEGTERTLAVTRIQFKCPVPYWHSHDFEYLNDDVVFAPTTRDIVNHGSAPAVAFIWFGGKTDGTNHTTNPRLINKATGLELEYAGDLEDGEYVIVNCDDYTATMIESNIANTGVASSGGASSIILDGSASANDDEYVGLYIKIISGTGTGQIRKCIDYDGLSKALTIDRAWDTVPDMTSEYVIYKLIWLVENGVDIEPTLLGFSDGVGVLDSMNTSFPVHGFPLVAGTNQIEVQEENGLLRLGIMFRHRWY